MPSPTSTFATLRALHLVIADALDDIQRVFSLCDPVSPPASPLPSPATPPPSFPPTPLSATFPSPPLTDSGDPSVDYPSPDLPFVPDSFSEQLALHPDAVSAAARIVAACGQMSNIVHRPFLSLCDAIMSYILPACMRLVEHLHVAEIVREAEENSRSLTTGQPLASNSSEPTSTALTSVSADVPMTLGRRTGSHTQKRIEGLHVTDIANVICSYAGTNYVNPNELVHVLRLLSTHHIFRETAPDTFALNRVASLLDSGKSVQSVFSEPGSKYDGSGGSPAFVALNTDELFKSAAYLTEAFTGAQLPAQGSTPNPSSPTNVALLGTAIPLASDCVNDCAACPYPSTTRSSSILTHIMYPEDEDVPTPPHLLENVGSYSPQAAVPRLLVTEPTAPLTLDLNLNLGEPEKPLAFNLAFRTNAPYFEWLENGGKDPLGGTGQAASITTPHIPTRIAGVTGDDMASPCNRSSCNPGKSFRLHRFSNAMKDTIAWEAPKAILGVFDWYSLPKGSTVVDVGGGIGSTTMVLARALNDPRFDLVKKQYAALDEGLQLASTAPLRHKSKLPSDPSFIAGDEARNDASSKNGLRLCFIVQDRPVVTALGIDAWRSKCPEMLDSGQVVFQDQDFFEPQSVLGAPHITRYPSVYLLRVVLHDWPDEAARRILINLRVASSPETRLVIAEHVLPLACVDEDIVDHANARALGGSSTAQWTLSSVLASIEGAEPTLVAPPLLSNLGKASASGYWMDLIMHISLNGKERTLREFCVLTLSAGWRITRMTRPEGSLFAYLVCEPISLPEDAQAIYNAVVLSSELSTVVTAPSDEPLHHSRMDPSRNKQLPARPVSLLSSPALQRSSSRCGTPTFGSRMLLPKEEELQSPRPRGSGAAKKWFKSKGLGVRSVVMQKVEKQKEEQIWARNASPRDRSDTQSAAPTSSSHMRVWWKKTPPGSTNNSTAAIQDLNGDARPTGRGRRGTLRSIDTPSTPSPHISPGHQHWPSTESVAFPAPDVSPPVTQARRPSVASITRKLSFATFGRRPSIPDITEPLPTPPPSVTLMELAPPPTLRGDTGQSLKHSEATANTSSSGRPATPRHQSLNLAGQAQESQPVSKSGPARPSRPDVAESPKPGILKSRPSPHASKQSSPVVSSTSESTLIQRRQRRVTLSNSPARTPVQVPGVPLPPDVTAREVRRIPSVPKLPRRLSIPMLRRKQSQTVVRGGDKE